MEDDFDDEDLKIQKKSLSTSIQNSNLDNNIPNETYNDCKWNRDRKYKSYYLDKSAELDKAPSLENVDITESECCSYGLVAEEYAAPHKLYVKEEWLRNRKIEEKEKVRWAYFYAELTNICGGTDTVKVIDRIITYGDIAGWGNWKDGREQIRNWMSFLKTRVSILDVKEEDMPKKYSEIDPNDTPEDIEERSAENLGCYFREKKINGEVKPVIYLCSARIENTAKQIGVEPKIMYAKVLLHEMAHAMMDETNVVQRVYRKAIYCYDGFNPSFHHWMEESLANYIMLQYVKAVKPEYYDDCKKIIGWQSAPYRLALKFEGKKIDWSFWRLKKQAIYHQLKEPNSPASKWFALAQKPKITKKDLQKALKDLIKSVKDLPR